MPSWCAAYSCSNERTVANRNRGITFHKFPKDKTLRKKWEMALRIKGFTASNHSIVCSQHFKQADFDRTGQIVRLRHGVIPSLFNFPAHLQKVVKSRTTSNSRKAAESLSVVSEHSPEAATSHPQPQPNDVNVSTLKDHNYALTESPTALKTKLNEAWARVEFLEREKKNAISREKRAKIIVQNLLEDLKEKNVINKELSEKLSLFSRWNVQKQGHEYTQDWKEFALMLHPHGPKVNKYLGDSTFTPPTSKHYKGAEICREDAGGTH